MALSEDELSRIHASPCPRREALLDLLRDLAREGRFGDMFETIDRVAANGAPHPLPIHRFYMDRVGRILLDAGFATQSPRWRERLRAWCHAHADWDRPLAKASGARQFEEAVRDLERAIEVLEAG